jgi:hydrogenase maturation protein HypF
LIASLTEFSRFGHLGYYPLAGGDRAAKEAIRPLIGLLSPQGELGAIEQYRDVLERIEPDGEKLRMICSQIKKGVNTTPTSSLGRLFDAVAALLGLGGQNRFEAELPMALEALTRAGEESAYPAELVQQADGMWIWRYEPVLEGMLADVRRGEAAGQMATRFHNTVCEALLVLAKEARTTTGLSTVALSGGVFCNRYLAKRMIKRLKSAGFGVLWKRRVPANDGGVALGQAAIAAAMLENHNTGIVSMKKQARPSRS